MMSTLKKGVRMKHKTVLGIIFILHVLQEKRKCNQKNKL